MLLLYSEYSVSNPEREILRKVIATCLNTPGLDFFLSLFPKQFNKVNIA